jgi:hypothetical protein
MSAGRERRRPRPRGRALRRGLRGLRVPRSMMQLETKARAFFDDVSVPEVATAPGSRKFSRLVVIFALWLGHFIASFSRR